jgi:hypothetical protein
VRDRDDRPEHGERGVEVAMLGLEVWRGKWLELDGESRAVKGAVETLDRVMVRGGAVVGVEQRTQSLSYLERAPKVALAAETRRSERVRYEARLRTLDPAELARAVARGRQLPLEVVMEEALPGL